MRRAVVGMLAVMLMVAALAVPVSAGGKFWGAKFDFAESFGPTDVGCGFDVDLTSHFVGSVRVIVMPDGGDMWEVTQAERDTMVGPGGTLVSDWYHSRQALRFAPDGSLVSLTFTGQLMAVELPDGTMFRSAGITRVDPLSTQEAFLLVDHGLSGDLDAFCAALAS